MSNIELTVRSKGNAEMQMASTGRVTLSVGGASGTSYYPSLIGKPSINAVELVGDKTFEELGDSPLTNMEIQFIFNRVFRG